jgi:SAM-dependent methyltransferase
LPVRLLRSSNRHTSRAKKRVVLHVGAPKTGSTFLQSVLWQNRGVLGNVGVGYPLEDDREHFAATMDLRELTWGGGRDPAWDGAWDRVAARIREWTGHTAVFSNELLGGATSDQIARAVQSVRPAEVDVVFTARDLVRQLTSDWQEQVRHTHAVTFDDFVDDLVAHGIDATPPFGPMFWGLHDPVRVLRPWADVVGADHVFVVTVPQRGAPRGVLWQRFADQLGVDPKVCDLEATASNPSLGAVEAELLRTVNERADRIPHRTYRDDIRGRLIVDVLQRRPGQAPIAFPERHLDWVRKRSQELMDGVRDAGYEVVGDLDELEPAPPVSSAVDPGRVGSETLEQAALDSLAGLVTEQPQPN